MVGNSEKNLVSEKETYYKMVDLYHNHNYK